MILCFTIIYIFLILEFSAKFPPCTLIPACTLIDIFGKCPPYTVIREERVQYYTKMLITWATWRHISTTTKF